ncbi:MAG: hypothetical protein ACM34I_00445, partial [bacterium]
MAETVDICRLDYLVGTLATAYKGLVTSLVMKDFCMTEAQGGVTLKGTILSMPEGQYKASLMHEGMELSAAQIGAGYFELTANADRIHTAKNLQIDIVQNGRHIGTFLLKRDKPDQFFAAALELSEEMKDVNLALLAASVKEKPGLLKNAEEIVSAIMSAKKDWRKLSDKIHSFAKDLFWTDRKAHFLCYDVFVKFSVAAAEKIDAFVSYKPVTNFIDLIEFPLQQETDREQLRMLIQKWLQGMEGSSIDLSYSLAQVKRVMLALNASFFDINLDPLVG